MKEEWLARYSPTTVADALELLDPYLVYYNTQRPHQGHACQNEIPDVAFPNRPVLPALPQRVQPNRWMAAEHRRMYRRRVTTNGTIQVDTHLYSIGHAYAGLPVMAQLDAEKAQLLVMRDDKVLKVCPLRGVLPDPMSFVEYFEKVKAEAYFIEQYHHHQWERTGDLP